MNQKTDNNKNLLLVIPIAAAVVMLVLLAVSIGTMVKENLREQEGTETPTDNRIILEGSHSPGYYSGEFDFSLKCTDENTKIIYTITSPMKRATSAKDKVTPTGEVYLFSGGKLPDPAKLNENGVEQSIEYSEPIKIPGKLVQASETVRVTTIVAAAFKGDERVSDYFYYSFFVDSNGKKPNYQDKFGSYVVSISIDEDNLYDYEKGILINGKAFADEVKKNPSREVDGWFPRNYNQRGRDWEREAHIQIFDKTGNLVVDQDVGLRIAGGMSRHNSVKSFRVITRSMYDEVNNKIEYNFFENAKDVYGNKINIFDRLVLRNSANDFGALMFKDVFLHKLGGLAGVEYQEGTPCTVYINGKYYSIMNIRESLDNDFIESHYKIPKEYVTMVSIASGTGYSFNYKLTSGPEEGLAEFKADMRKLISTNYSNKDISEINQIIDVDNFIKYMAYQMYIANADWPHNNVLAWKYCGLPNSSVYGMDGKWRFILKDLDLSTSFTSVHHDSYASVLGSGMSDGEPSIGQVFKSCIKNKEFANRFKEYMRKLCNEYITPNTVNSLLDTLQNEREKDMEMFWRYYGGSKRNWVNQINSFKSFTATRSKWMLNNLNRYI